jgi:hypothetical protein
MNENVTKLIESLAEKLGTTSQYLWGILLKQAPIDATIGVVFNILVLLFGFLLFKIHKRLMKEDINDEFNQNFYEKYDILVSTPMLIGLIAFVVLFCVSLCNIENIINGYFNPEYWSLQQILRKIN